MVCETTWTLVQTLNNPKSDVAWILELQINTCISNTAKYFRFRTFSSWFVCSKIMIVKYKTEKPIHFILSLMVSPLFHWIRNLINGTLQQREFCFIHRIWIKAEHSQFRDKSEISGSFTKTVILMSQYNYKQLSGMISSIIYSRLKERQKNRPFWKALQIWSNFS